MTQTATRIDSITPLGWDAAWDWTSDLADEFAQPYFQKLMAFVDSQRQSHVVYPEPSRMFEAFRLTPRASVRVVILGQDPYHGEGQAQGLSFSVPRDTRIPPSLQNIFRELSSDCDLPIPAHGDLSNWASQGVLLLNAVLSVRAGAAFSHRGQGWEWFTDSVIRCVSNLQPFCVFILWGRPAAAKVSLIDARHSIITAPHPSPLSAYRGFFGSQVFSRCNQALAQNGYWPIGWTSDLTLGSAIFVPESS